MKVAWIAALAAAVLVVTGCGSNNSDSGKTPAAKAVSSLGNAVNADSGATAPAPIPPSLAPPSDEETGVGDAGKASCATPASDLASDLSTVNTATLCLLNAERSARRLRPLRNNPKLAAAALQHSADMVKRDYFAHDTLGGGGFDTRIVKTGYLKAAHGWTIGENIAWGSGDQATPAAIVDHWMHSPGHRANILNRRYTEIGLGVAVGAPEDVGGLPGLTYTTDFGTRK